MYEARKLIHQAQSDSILFAHRASEQLQDKAPDEALQLCEEGVKQFPFYAEGHYVLARCYQELDRLDEAQAEFERTLSFNPGHLKALKALAFLNYKKKMAAHGRSILEIMAQYDPLNVELIEFLNRPETESTPEIQEDVQPAEPAAGEAVDEDVLEEEIVAAASIDETQFIMDEQSDDETVISFDVEDDFEEMPITEEDFDFNVEEEMVSDEESTKVEEAQDTEEPAILDETKPPVSDETALHNVVDELFSEEAPAIDLDLGQDSPGLDLEDIADLTVTGAQEREDFERNTIDQHLDDTKSFMKPLDLDQFDNTEDDFSTLIEGYFQNSDEEVPVQEDGNSNDNADMEQPVEERSFLDTSVIFKERRSEDQDEETPQPASEKVIEDMNKVADELDQMNTQVTFSVEQEIEASSNLPQTDNQDELLKAQEPEASIESLGDVIERIENTPIPREKITEDFDSKNAASLDEEEVSIDDILQNPTLLTPTFGEILIAQKKFQDAREVFKALAKSDPENIRFKKKIEFLDKIVAMQK